MAMRLLLCLLIASCTGFRLTQQLGPQLLPLNRCALPPAIFMVESDSQEAGSDFVGPEPEEEQSVKSSTGAGVMPEKFLGVFDMSTTAGSLGASLTVAVIFCGA